MSNIYEMVDRNKKELNDLNEGIGAICVAPTQELKMELTTEANVAFREAYAGTVINMAYRIAQEEVTKAQQYIKEEIAEATKHLEETTDMALRIISEKETEIERLRISLLHMEEANNRLSAENRDLREHKFNFDKFKETIKSFMN